MSTAPDTTDRGVLSALLATAPPTFRIEDDTGSYDAATLIAWSRSADSALRDAGVRPGDRVVATVGRTARDIALIIGAQDRGAVVAPVDNAVPERRRDTIIDNCAARYLAKIDPSGNPVVDPTPVASTHEHVGADALAGSLMIYTSGSSGTPKGIVCPGPAIAFAVDAIGQLLQYQPTDLIAQPLPLTFDYGLYQVWLAMAAGARVRLYGDGAAGPTFLNRLDRDRVTVLPSMPVLSESLIRIGDRRGRTLDHVRLITSTGGDCPDRQVAALRRLAPHAQIAPMYGLTECKRATISAPDATGGPLGAGRPLPGTDVRIRTQDRIDLPAGESGEIHVAGPHVMAGYWPLQDTDLNHRFYTDTDGTRWVATGDRGHLDRDGVLFVEGRLDDVFKSNGYRTSATEVEHALTSIDGVEQACVVPPQAERPYTAFYVGSATPQQVRSLLHDSLETPKHPPALIVLKTLPVNANGKVDRPALARLATPKEVRG